MSRAGMSTRGKAEAACVPTDADRRRAANARKAEETSRLDLPLKSDPIGNAIPGLIVGGLLAGLEAAAAGAGLAGAAGSVAKHSAEHAAADLIEHGAHAAAHAIAHDKSHEPDARGAAAPTRAEGDQRESGEAFGPPAPPNARANGTDSATPAGRSSAKGTSEVAPEPRTSEPPTLRGQDRVPYRPGAAPVRVPEAPQAMVMSAAIVIRG